MNTELILSIFMQMLIAKEMEIAELEEDGIPEKLDVFHKIFLNVISNLSQMLTLIAGIIFANSGEKNTEEVSKEELQEVLITMIKVMLANLEELGVSTNAFSALTGISLIRALENEMPILITKGSQQRAEALKNELAEKSGSHKTDWDELLDAYWDGEENDAE